MPVTVLPEHFDRLGPTLVRHRPTGATFWADPTPSHARRQIDSWMRGHLDAYADDFDLDQLKDAATEALRRLRTEDANP